MLSASLRCWAEKGVRGGSPRGGTSRRATEVTVGETVAACTAAGTVQEVRSGQIRDRVPRQSRRDSLLDGTSGATPREEPGCLRGFLSPAVTPGRLLSGPPTASTLPSQTSAQPPLSWTSRPCGLLRRAPIKGPVLKGAGSRCVCWWAGAVGRGQAGFGGEV